MSTRQPVITALEDRPVPVRTTLAAAWTSFMFLSAYVDILNFYRPGVVPDILAGKVWKFDISQTFAVTALASMAIPALMVVLSVTLPARVCRVLNLVVAAVFAPYSAFNLAGESWTLFYGLGILLELILLGLIVRNAWTWPRTAPSLQGQGSSSPARRSSSGAWAPTPPPG